MSLATASSFPPEGSQENLERLAALSLSPDAALDLWTAVHEEVQGQLALLETEVRHKAGALRVQAGRTKGDRFFLFTYRTFSLPGSELDPVVVGLTFIPNGEGVTVEADVSGEGTGDSVWSVPNKTVAKSREELVEAARELAQNLCPAASAIVAALKEDNCKVE
jgi:hypothetical protein